MGAGEGGGGEKTIWVGGAQQEVFFPLPTHFEEAAGKKRAGFRTSAKRWTSSR